MGSRSRRPKYGNTQYRMMYDLLKENKSMTEKELQKANVMNPESTRFKVQEFYKVKVVREVVDEKRIKFTTKKQKTIKYTLHG